MDFRKALNNVVGKVDPRVKPPEEEVIKFKKGAGRRYINVGIATRDFYLGVANALEDKELLEHAKEVEQAIYSKNSDKFALNDRMFKVRMQELGAWKTVKGMGIYQKAKIMRRLGKLANKHKEAENESE